MDVGEFSNLVSIIEAPVINTPVMRGPLISLGQRGGTGLHRDRSGRRGTKAKAGTI